MWLRRDSLYAKQSVGVNRQGGTTDCLRIFSKCDHSIMYARWLWMPSLWCERDSRSIARCLVLYSLTPRYFVPDTVGITMACRCNQCFPLSHCQTNLRRSHMVRLGIIFQSFSHFWSRTRFCCSCCRLSEDHCIVGKECEILRDVVWEIVDVHQE